MTRCIVIDDDQDIVEAFCDILDAVGTEVLATGNDGNDAVNLYKKHQPDLVFLDLNMPVYDGFYAIEEIKKINLNSKIIAITGDTSDLVMNVLDSLNILVISKPFDIHSIKQIIVDALLTPDELGDYVLFTIQYKFKGEDKSYLCIVTYEQYMNFKKLPVVEECEIINNYQQHIEMHKQKIQKALDMALKNDTSYLRMLSDIAP